MKVAIVEPVGNHGGMDHYNLGLAHGLCENGWQVELFTSGSSRRLNNPNLTITDAYRGAYGSGHVVVRAIKYAQGSWRSLKSAVNSNVALVHLHFFQIGVLEFFNVLLAKLLRLKVVATVHDVEPLAGNVNGFLKGWVFANLDGVIVHNSTSQRELRAVSATAANNCAVIPHGNYAHLLDDFERMAAEGPSARAQLGIEQHAKTILFFGQIKPTKGLDTLLHSLPAVLSQHPDAQLLIAGRPWRDDFAAYQATIDALSIGDAIHQNISYVDDERVNQYFAAADVVVLPYRRIYQSGVLLLSMTFGRPTIVSDLAAMREVVSDGINGYIFGVDDAADLAATIVAAFDDWVSAEKVGQNAKKHMLEAYDWHVIAQKTAQFYERVAKE